VPAAQSLKSLNSDHIEQFRDQGWCVVEGLFDDREVAALAAEVDRFQREGLVRNVRTEGDGETPSSERANLQLIPLFDKSPLIRALPFADRVTDAVSRLIGDPYLLHLDQMFLKPGRVGTGTSWHQDNAYFKIADPLRGTAMWVAVHDATQANGTLRLIPGSHKESYPHERDPNSDHHIGCSPPDERAVPVEVAAGGAAFFCYGVAHATGDNHTDHDRAGLAFHFLHESCADDDLVAEGRDRRPWVTGPHAQGGQPEYGVDVRGDFARQVERTLAAA
jgi:phytanoyl-CoA hydroxylase